MYVFPWSTPNLSLRFRELWFVPYRNFIQLLMSLVTIPSRAFTLFPFINAIMLLTRHCQHRQWICLTCSARMVAQTEKSTKQETPTAYIIVNRYVFPGLQELWYKQKKRQNRKHQRQISSSTELSYMVCTNCGTHGKIEKIGNTNRRYHRQQRCLTWSKLILTQTGK